MIGRLTGVVVGEEPDGGILLDVAGVGYELAAPLGTLGRARPAAQSERDPITLYVHTHVREDAISLFAFPTPEDKAVFRLLISVSNIGPKTALAVLSVMDADELARALAAKDLAKLLSVPGIGRKTAERLLLELKDKLAPVRRTPADGKSALPAGVEPPKEEILLRALTGMGYRPNEAERAVQQLRGRLQDHAVPELIREALALLAK